MSHVFHRNQNASERTAKLNAMAHQLDDVSGRVEGLEEAVTASNGGVPLPSADPGDLVVYYENGKA